MKLASIVMCCLLLAAPASASLFGKDIYIFKDYTALNGSYNGSPLCTQDNGYCAGQPTQGSGQQNAITIWNNATTVTYDGDFSIVDSQMLVSQGDAAEPGYSFTDREGYGIYQTDVWPGVGIAAEEQEVAVFAGSGGGAPFTMLLESQEPGSPVAIFRGRNLQTGNLQEWQDDGESIIARVNATGTIYEQTGRVCTAGNGLCNQTGWTLHDQDLNTTSNVTFNNITATGTILAPEGSFSDPSIAFNTTANGIYLSDIGEFTFKLNNGGFWKIDTTTIRSATAGGAYIRQSGGNTTIPTFTVVSDTDTGVGGDSNDALSLITGGREAIRITNAQRVGINKDTPGAQLQIDSGNTGIPALILKNAVGQVGNIFQTKASDGTIQLFIEASGRLRDNTDGMRLWGLDIGGAATAVGVGITAQARGTGTLQGLSFSPYLYPEDPAGTTYGVIMLTRYGGAAYDYDINNIRNYYTRVDSLTGYNSTVGNVYNIYSANPGGTGTGNITNWYGLFVDQVTSATDNNWAIYTSGSTPSYFGGDVEIHGSLDVDGNITGENVFLPQYIFVHTNQTIPLTAVNEWENITFSQEAAALKEGVQHNHAGNTNDTFNITATGIYRIHYDLDVQDTSPSATDIDVAGRMVHTNGTELEGSVMETDITKQDIETEISHTFLVQLTAGDQIKLQFTADDEDVEVATHATFGTHPDSATLVIEKAYN